MADPTEQVGVSDSGTAMAAPTQTVASSPIQPIVAEAPVGSPTPGTGLQTTAALAVQPAAQQSESSSATHSDPQVTKIKASGSQPGKSGNSSDSTASATHASEFKGVDTTDDDLTTVAEVGELSAGDSLKLRAKPKRTAKLNMKYLPKSTVESWLTDGSKALLKGAGLHILAERSPLPVDEARAIEAIRNFTPNTGTTFVTVDGEYKTIKIDPESVAEALELPKELGYYPDRRDKSRDACLAALNEPPPNCRTKKVTNDGYWVDFITDPDLKGACKIIDSYLNVNGKLHGRLTWTHFRCMHKQTEAEGAMVCDWRRVMRENFIERYLVHPHEPCRAGGILTLMIRKQLKKEEVVPPTTAAALLTPTQPMEVDPQDTAGSSEPTKAKRKKKEVQFIEVPVIIKEKPAPALEEVESLTPPDSPVAEPKKPDSDDSLLDITMLYASDGSEDNNTQQADDNIEQALLLSLVGAATQPVEEPVTGVDPSEPSLPPSLAKLEEQVTAEQQKDHGPSLLSKLVQALPPPPASFTEGTPRTKFTAEEKGKSVAEPSTETTEQPTPDIDPESEKPAIAQGITSSHTVQTRQLPKCMLPGADESESESEEEEMDTAEYGQWLQEQDQEQVEKDVEEVTKIINEDPLQLIPNLFADMFLNHCKQSRVLKAAQALLKQSLHEQKRQRKQIKNLQAAEDKEKREALAKQKAGNEEESKKLKAQVVELTLKNQGTENENKALLAKQTQLQQKHYLLAKAHASLLAQLSEAEKKRAEEEKEKKKLEQEHKAQLLKHEAEQIKAKALEAEKAALVAKLAEIEEEGDAGVAEALAACGGNRDKALSRQTKRYISYKAGYQKAITELSNLKAELEKEKAKHDKGKGKAQED